MCRYTHVDPQSIWNRLLLYKYYYWIRNIGGKPTKMPKSLPGFQRFFIFWACCIGWQGYKHV